MLLPVYCCLQLLLHVSVHCTRYSALCSATASEHNHCASECPDLAAALTNLSYNLAADLEIIAIALVMPLELRVVSYDGICCSSACC